jgi:hypothetical protein
VHGKLHGIGAAGFGDQEDLADFVHGVEGLAKTSRHSKVYLGHPCPLRGLVP